MDSKGGGFRVLTDVRGSDSSRFFIFGQSGFQRVSLKQILNFKGWNF